MPRRNRRKGVRPQAQRGRNSMPAAFAPRLNGLPQRRKALLPMVAPAGTCPTGKIRYGTEADAAEALARALHNREIMQSPVREERYYPMPGDKPCICQGYHLTHTKRRES